MIQGRYKFLITPKIIMSSSIELPVCSGCNRHIMPNDKSVKLNCPECGEVLLWRCQSCRESASSYVCNSCKFSGP